MSLSFFFLRLYEFKKEVWRTAGGQEVVTGDSLGHHSPFHFCSIVFPPYFWIRERGKEGLKVEALFIVYKDPWTKVTNFHVWQGHRLLDCSQQSFYFACRRSQVQLLAYPCMPVKLMPGTVEQWSSKWRFGPIWGLHLHLKRVAKSWVQPNRNLALGTLNITYIHTHIHTYIHTHSGASLNKWPIHQAKISVGFCLT